MDAWITKEIILKQIFDNIMPSSSNLRQKLNTGHYGPAPTVNVIPELDGNRVNAMTVQPICFHNKPGLGCLSYNIHELFYNIPRGQFQSAKTGAKKNCEVLLP